MGKQKVYQIDVHDKVVILRADLNVPHKGEVISDDNRIVQALPTIKYLREHGAKVLVMSHLGKVKHSDPEKAKEQMAKNSLEMVAKRMSELLESPVLFIKETRGEELEKAVKGLRKGDVALMQNTRYEKGEEKNDPELSAYWASLGDAYVNDAFGSCHRAHASTYGIPEIYKKEGKATTIGYLVEKEASSLGQCVETKEHPYVAIMGGSKVSDKIKVIEGLLKKADKILIGGAMAFTFMKALGYEIGSSLVELDQVDFAKKCIKEGKGKLVLPVDYVCADSLDDPKDVYTTINQNIREGFMGLDVGPKTNALYKKELEGAKVIFWNGPLGAFENPLFAKGTEEICKSIISVKGAFSVIGGGDSASAVNKYGYGSKFSHVSTGGGASLEMIENDGKLPGIEVIEEEK